jgi:SAM-dependent methyltransferase
MPREETRAAAPETPADVVRAFYESHPYPAPIGDLDRHRDLYRNPDRRRALSLLLWPTEKSQASREILVAGCGTSQAAIHALREPDALVTAIDISETSLRYTRDLQQKYRLRNLDLHQLAIEQIGELGHIFDQIVCTGVLHHLPDPDIGLRSLRNVLAPRGAMHVMVYGTYGRAGIYMMQEYCRLLGISATEAELRELGTTIGALSADHPIAGVSIRAKDFRNPDALAMRCSTPKTAPIPCRSSMPGWSGAAYPSGAGSNRLPISRNAGRWRACHTPRASPRSFLSPDSRHVKLLGLKVA